MKPEEEKQVVYRFIVPPSPGSYRQETLHAAVAVVLSLAFAALVVWWASS